MPRKYELSWDRTHKRWIKTIEGKKHYFGKGSTKSDIASYRAALRAYHDFIGVVAEAAVANQPKRRAKKPTWRYKNTIFGLYDRFLDQEFSRLSAGHISPTAFKSTKYSMDAFIGFFGARAGKAGSPSLINEDAIRGYYKRLMSRVNHAEAKKRVSVYTAKTLFSSVRPFIRYCYELRHINELPRNIDSRRFSFSERKSLQNQAGHRIQIFTKDELYQLLDGCYASKKWINLRLYILLGLNCGFTSIDIATLTAENISIDEKSGLYRVTKHRTKTGEEGRWLLWDRTAALLETVCGDRLAGGSNRVLFLSGQGRNLSEPIMKSGDGGAASYGNVVIHRPTSIQRRFYSLSRRVFPDRTKHLTHKNLRKTGASMIRNLGVNNSDRIARTYLAHRGETVADRHYLAMCFDDLDSALLEVGVALGFHGDEVA